MATPAEKLATSLEALAEACRDGRTVLRARDLGRTHRERLTAAGFLQDVVKGWYYRTRPDQINGESTSWYVAFWDFCAQYLTLRFGKDWCLAPEQSLQWHAGDRTIPRQLLVRSPRGDNSVLALPFDTSLLSLRAAIPATQDMVQDEGMRLMSIPAALTTLPPDFYANHPLESQTALARITHASELLPPLLERGQTTVAGRLIGAFRAIGREETADDIAKAMRAAGHDVRVSDPFTSPPEVMLQEANASPQVQRLRLLWNAMRRDVIDNFPAPPPSRPDPEAYLLAVEEAYVSDAYHSLSIEGYQVSRELIERVRRNEWNPDAREADCRLRDAMAAKGYWLAFQNVKRSVARVLAGENAGAAAADDHGDWYRELFAPSVQAGILGAAELAGYRNGPVFIRLSRHVPPSPHAVRELMPAFFELLQGEEHPAVRVVLGHFFFVNIHPYMDGNGRVGRFLMNVMAAAGGYPWLVVPVEQRGEYLGALEEASVEGRIVGLAKLLASLRP
ncbi:MAG TPA: Fic family protein [Candidatus Krumholzibacteria bacterium]|nr:Fic family protein [Candidatus Krumholzibacteria bacterium]HRX49762.1 Fic family protein [Candidatus Krumholzibacteria bacterium]